MWGDPGPESKISFFRGTEYGTELRSLRRCQPSINIASEATEIKIVG